MDVDGNWMEKLISAVENKPLLHNNALKDCSNRDLSENAWTQLPNVAGAQELQCPMSFQELKGPRSSRELECPMSFQELKGPRSSRELVGHMPSNKGRGSMSSQEQESPCHPKN
ncbi:hypothetical protein RRG08_064341 [Elysia crispata]|uniref:Uncharacterized protein n=1 Tax=Elysia crispata TaxID=231223 RepID=A0AAE0ZK41_9GAST|nr:hypothetical protein RRG08_064341 [Elysia crispata]